MFTSAQAVAEGWSRRQVERRRDAGRWRRVCGLGLTAQPGPDGPAARAWAAVLTWPEAVVGGSLAAELHGFPIDAARHGDVVVYSTAGRAPGLRLRPLRVALAEDDVTIRCGIRLTTPALTAVDCLAWFDWASALDLFAWTSTHGVLDREALARNARQRLGRPGTPQLIRLLHRTQHGAVSAAEDRFHSLLRRAGITGWTAAAMLDDAGGRIGVVDVLFPAERIVIEIDGAAAHSGRDAFVRDRRRQNRLVHAGYLVLRFTWWDLVHRPEAVVAEVRLALTVRRTTA